MDESSEGLDREERRTQVALFRHSLVGGLASARLEPGELTRELRKLARRNYRIPGRGRQRPNSHKRRRRPPDRVSVSSLRRWLTLLKEGGLEALKPKLRSDYGVSRAIPEKWLQTAIALRRKVPSRTARVLVEIMSLLQDYPVAGINAHTLDKTLRKRGVTRKRMRKPKPRTKRWSARHVNDLWQGDATPGVWLLDPRDPTGKRKVQTHLFLWIDDVSRLVPHAEFFFDEKLPRMERTLKMGILKRGPPRRAYTDNGNVFRAIQYKATLAELEIKPIHSRKYRPQGRGKIERIFGVIQNDFYPEVSEAGITTLPELNEALHAWLETVYHNRLHSETKQTPLEAYRKGLKHVQPADPARVARAFLWRFHRKVSENGYISLRGNSYSVDPTWGSRTIELRCDPFDLSQIDIYQDCRPVARAHVRNLKHAHCLELEPLQVPPPPPVEVSGVSYLDLVRKKYRRQLAAECGLSYRDALEKPQEEKEEPQ